MRILLAWAILMTVAVAARADEPIDVAPDWIKQPTQGELSAAWPYDAYRRGLSGEAEISCQVTPAGTLEGCKVVAEKPLGRGFGDAALALAPSFAMKPASRGGQAVRSTVRIPIRFIMPGGAPIYDSKITTVVAPHWALAPSYADLMAAWPETATAEVGHVALRCSVAPGGELRRCSTASEVPRSQGFAKAAHSLVPKFQLLILPEQAKSLTGTSVTVPVHFTGPQHSAPRAMTNPRWLKSINPEAVVAIYPQQAIAAGVRSGKGVADCAVARDGKLVDCKPSSAAPPGLGFSEAAAKVASVFQMNPWSDGGVPMDGLRLKLPITFNLAPEDAPKP
jgi:TonB family protein